MDFLEPQVPLLKMEVVPLPPRLVVRIKYDYHI